MNLQFLPQFIEKYMQDRGYGPYALEWKDYVVPASGERTIQAGESLYFYAMDNVNISPGVKVRSPSGVIDWINLKSEPVWVHSGEIRLTNTSSNPQYVAFVQAIPKTN